MFLRTNCSTRKLLSPFLLEKTNKHKTQNLKPYLKKKQFLNGVAFEDLSQ